jgi:hypothetical protein
MQTNFGWHTALSPTLKYLTVWLLHACNSLFVNTPWFTLLSCVNIQPTILLSIWIKLFYPSATVSYWKGRT